MLVYYRSRALENPERIRLDSVFGPYAAASVVVASAFVMEFILSAADPRMTIHHSGAVERQGICGTRSRPREPRQAQ
jgi:hypothetical protein